MPPVDVDLAVTPVDFDDRRAEVIRLSRICLTYGLSSTASRYASSISAVGEPVSGEWIVPVM